MALSDENIEKVCMILGVVNPVLNQQITLMGSSFTSVKQTAIEEQIALWDAGAGVKTTKLHPTESNKGVETNPNAVRSQIRQRIAVLLERPDWAGSGAKLQRG